MAEFIPKRAAKILECKRRPRRGSKRFLLRLREGYIQGVLSRNNQREHWSPDLLCKV